MTKMNLETAVKHLTWRLTQPRISPYQKDIDAFNCIVETLNTATDASVENDRLFAKLLIEKLIMLTEGGKRPMKEAISIIEEILETSLSGWFGEFCRNVETARLNNVFDECYVEVPKTGNIAVDGKRVIDAAHTLAEVNEKISKANRPYTRDEFEPFFKRLVFDLKGKHSQSL